MLDRALLPHKAMLFWACGQVQPLFMIVGGYKSSYTRDEYQNE
jgi:hypothetical protein